MTRQRNHQLNTQFADDTKLFGPAQCRRDRELLQNELDKLVSWAEQWQMEFNVNNCKVMHVGRRNEGYTCEIGGVAIESTTLEKDLGVYVSADLKVSSQYSQIYNKASKLLGMVGRNIVSRLPEILINIYKSIVRPHLEFCSPACLLTIKKTASYWKRFNSASRECSAISGN